MADEPQATPKEDAEQPTKKTDEPQTTDLIHVTGKSIELPFTKSTPVRETAQPEVPRTLRDTALARWEELIMGDTNANPEWKIENLIDLATAYAKAGNQTDAIRVLRSTAPEAGSDKLDVSDRIKYGVKIGVALDAAGEHQSALGFLLGSRKYLEDSTVGDWRESGLAEEAVERIVMGLAEIGEFREAKIVLDLPLKADATYRLGGRNAEMNTRLKTKIAGMQIESGDREGGLATLDGALKDAAKEFAFSSKKDKAARLTSISNAFLRAGEIERAIEAVTGSDAPIEQLAYISTTVALRGDTDKASQILTDNLPGSSAKERALTQVVQELTSRGKVDDAVDIALSVVTNIKNPSSRAFSVLSTIHAVEKRPTDREKLKKMLDLAAEAVRENDSQRSKIAMLHRVSHAYDSLGFTDEREALLKEAMQLEYGRDWRQVEDLHERNKYALKALEAGDVDLALEIAGTLQDIDAIAVFKKIAALPTPEKADLPELPPAEEN